MSLSLNTNVAALSSHNSLRSNDHLLGKVIKRLSSGLRINSAADDPSGLSISQRLTTQIKGLERASLNAQDAMSFLQTAESALAETHTILQRMREIAIQGSNGVLTASDRRVLQNEIEQLREEVDRIANASEFNTKKLLDGSVSALWSADSDETEVIVTGKVREGNYSLEIETTPVENHVLKSDIFKVKTQAQGLEDVDLGATRARLELTLDAATTANAGTLTFNFGTNENHQLPVAAGVTSTQLADIINQNDDLSSYIVASTNGDTLILESRMEGSEGNSFTVASDTAGAAGFTITSTQHFSGGDDHPSGIVSVGDPDRLPSSTGTNGNYTIYADNRVTHDPAGDTAHVVAEYGQPVGGEIETASTPGAIASHVDATAGATTAQTGSGYAILEVLQGGTVDGAGANEILARVSFDNGQTWFNTGNIDTGAAVTVSDGTNTFNLTALTAGNTINTGDKVLIALNDRDFNNAAHAEVQVDSPFNDGQGNTTQRGPRYSFPEGDLDNGRRTIEVGYLNSETGEVEFGTIDMEVGTLASNDASNNDPRSENLAVSFDVLASGGPAFSSTKLWQIDKFYNVDGNFILGENGKPITIYNADGDKAEIFIDPEDSLDELADKISSAVAKPISEGGLGMSTGDMNLDSHICDFVTEPVPGTDEALRGTLVIRSPKMGTRGMIYFSADEDLTNALSLATIQTPEVDPMEITVRDAHTGDLIGVETVADATLRKVISGVEVRLDPNLDVDVTWDAAQRTFNFTSAPGTVTENIHIVDNSHSFQIGAYEGQVIESNIAEMTADALNINRVIVVDQTLAQHSITYLNEARDKVSSERSRIGALINRLEHTVNNIAAQNISSTSARSRLMDLDMAREASEFSKLQMLTQAAQSMLQQANKVPENLLQLLRG